MRKKTEKFKDRVMGMDWNTVGEAEYMEMEWMEFEQKEHKEMTKLLEQSELEFGMKRKEYEGTGVRMIKADDVEMRLTENEEFNDELEHTILDKLLEEWVDDNDLVIKDTVVENDSVHNNKTGE